MPIRSIGSSTGETPKVPTLRQAIKARLNIPIRNAVSLIFKPGKYDVITLICEEKFRVNVRNDEPLFDDLSTLLDSIVKDGLALFVDVPEDSEGKFELLIDDETKIDWTEYEWGFKHEAIPEKKKRATKEPRASRAKAK